jgi:ABC-2 type transport system permease protein/sodium transport system permease protein
MVHQAFLWISGGTRGPEEHLEGILRLMRTAQEEYPVILILALVVPAFAEELFFRGYLFAALRFRCGPVATILISSVLFGFFHVVTESFDRFLPSTLLGLILGGVAWWTGSVIPGMLLHAAHNVMLFMVGGGGLAGAESVPWTWQLAGLGGTAVGVVLICLGGWRAQRVGESAITADSP